MAQKTFDPREISIALEVELLEDFGETAFAMLRNFIFGSPVGNPDIWQNPESAPPGYVGGHFRRNWIVSIGGFNTEELEGEDVSGAPTLARGRSQIEKFKRATAGTNLVIQNNVPYANRLAQGHSVQAQAGWIDEAIDLALPIPGGTTELR